MSLRFLGLLLLLWIPASAVYSKHHSMSCGAFYGRSSDLNLQRPPRRVLLVPLLSRDPYTNESSRWSEQPARTLEAFYRRRFNADVKQLRNIWSWSDYYRKVEQIMKQSRPFDRVIFISHGGFDGPILKNSEYWHSFEVTGNQGKLLQFSEAQPGLKNMLSLTYDTQKNPVFSDYMASRWPELASMKFSDIWHQLTSLEKQLVPVDRACFQRQCPQDRLAMRQGEELEYQIHLCELLCRESLFKIKTSEELSAERFFRFTKSLSSLVTTDGMVFFGACNPGSAAPEKATEPDKTEFLINSTLAGGPHKSYVHLVSAATGRIAAGPIGQSSAEDIINRIIMFEAGRPQRYLCVVAPARSDPVERWPIN
jgi:hypothetical protein